MPNATRAADRAARIARRTPGGTAAAAAAAAALLLGGCGGALAATAPAAPPPAAVGVAPWPTFQGTYGRNPLVATSGAAAAALAVSWRFKTGGSIVAAPSVVHGVAYFTSMDDKVYAVNVATGRLIWSFRANNVIMSEPLVVGSRLFFSSGDKGWTGTGASKIRGAGPAAVYALDASTGHLLWSFPTHGEAMPTPTYQDGVLYEPTGGGYFYAIDAATGHLLWDLHDGAIVSMSSPAIAGGIAVFGGVGAGPPAYYGVNLQTHKLAWTVPIEGAWGGPDDLSPTIVGGIAYVQAPEGNQTITSMEMAIAVSSGRLVWERALGTGPANFHGGEEAGITTVVDGVAYVGSPVLNGVWALSAATGKPVWHSPLTVPVRTAPAVDGTHVFVVSAGQLFALSRATGAPQGGLTIGHRPAESDATYSQIPCASPSPVIAGQTLMAAGGAQDTLVATPLSTILAGALPQGAVAG